MYIEQILVQILRRLLEKSGDCERRIMAYFSFENIRISGIQTAVPKECIEISSFMDVFGEETVKKSMNMTGVKKVRQSHDKQTASDLGYVAAKALINRMQIDIDTIDGIVFVSLSPDYFRPQTGCVLQKRLGISDKCAVFDISSGCSGFMYGLQTACSIMSCSDMKKIILITAETVRKTACTNDKSTILLFGDGASALLLEKDDTSNDSIKGMLKSDGNRYTSIVIPAGGFRNKDASKKPYLCEDGNEKTNYHLHMEGTDVFNFAVFDIPKTIKEFMGKSSEAIKDYDYFVFHQANAFISKQLIKRFKIPKDRMLMSIEEYGNTSSASIPITLSHNFQFDNSNEKKRVLMCGFGVGLSWGVSSCWITPATIFPVIETEDYYEDGLIKE